MQTKKTTYLSPKELAFQLDVSERTAYRFCESGLVPAFKVGSRWRIHADKLPEIFDERALGYDTGEETESDAKVRAQIVQRMRKAGW